VSLNEYIAHRPHLFKVDEGFVQKSVTLVDNRVAEGPKHAEDISSQDAVNALITMIGASGGRLPCNLLQQLYEKNPKYQSIVKAAGGPKKFCLKHDDELEFVESGPGFIKRRNPEVGPEEVQLQKPAQPTTSVRSACLGASGLSTEPMCGGPKSSVDGLPLEVTSASSPSRVFQEPCKFAKGKHGNSLGFAIVMLEDMRVRNAVLLEGTHITVGGVRMEVRPHISKATGRVADWAEAIPATCLCLCRLAP
jgi:hypothetical protein